MVDQDRIVSRKERRQLVPLSDAQVYRMERAGLFPRHVRLSEHRIGWSLMEIQQWISEQKEARQTDAAR